MQTDTSRGTFDEVFQNSPSEVVAIAQQLRALIIKVFPNVVEVPRPGEQNVGYGVGPGKANEIFGYLCPVKDYLRLGFYFGGALPDPKQVLVGEGKRLRHIKLYSLAEAARPEIKQLLLAAVRERQEALGQKKKKK